MKLIFMGTPDFAVPTLDALAHAGHEIVAVYSQPPRPAGRGKKERKSPVHMRAEALGVEVKTPLSLKTDEAAAEIEALGADAAVVVAYGQILPQRILDAPEYGCVNVHASLLPRWRGAAPIHRAIMAGDDVTGVCIMQMEAGLDTGPVLARAETKIAAVDTTASLHDTLAAQGAGLINDVLAAFEADTAVAESQPEEGVTYAKKIDKAEARIDWTRSATDIDRQVRGLFPFPGAWFEFAGERIKVISGSVENATGLAGELLDDRLLVACGEHAYRLTKVQRAGKGTVDADAFLRGREVPKGTRFD